MLGWLDQFLVGWIEVLLLPQPLVWLLGFSNNHSLLSIVQYWHHHIETRHIQYNDPVYKSYCKWFVSKICMVHFHQQFCCCLYKKQVMPFFRLKMIPPSYLPVSSKRLKFPKEMLFFTFAAAIETTKLNIQIWRVKGSFFIRCTLS